MLNQNEAIPGDCHNPIITNAFATFILILTIVKENASLGRKLQGEQGGITSEERKVLPWRYHICMESSTPQLRVNSSQTQEKTCSPCYSLSSPTS